MAKDANCCRLNGAGKRTKDCRGLLTKWPKIRPRVVRPQQS